MYVILFVLVLHIAPYLIKWTAKMSLYFKK